MNRRPQVIREHGTPISVRKLKDGRCEAVFFGDGTCCRTFGETEQEAIALAVRWLIGAKRSENRREINQL